MTLMLVPGASAPRALMRCSYHCILLLLRKIQSPGDMYSLPVVMWYMLLSIVSLLPREVPEQYPVQIAGMAGSAVQDDLDLHPDSLAHALVGVDVLFDAPVPIRGPNARVAQQASIC